MEKFDINRANNQLNNIIMDVNNRESIKETAEKIGELTKKAISLLEKYASLPSK